MAPMTSRKLALGAMIALAAQGCGLFGGAKHPKIHVTGVQVKGVEVTLKPLKVSAQLDLMLRVDNPNDFDLKVRSVRGQVTLAGRQNVPIQAQPEVWLPAEKSTDVTIPAQVPLEAVVEVVRTSIKSDCVPYAFEGTADLIATSSLELEKNGYPFKKEGCLPRDRKSVV